MRFELSDCVTAATTSASSTPARAQERPRRSPRPCRVLPLKLRSRFENAAALRVDDAHIAVTLGKQRCELGPTPPAANDDDIRHTPVSAYAEVNGALG